MCPRWQIDKFGFPETTSLERILSQASRERIWEINLAGRGEPTRLRQLGFRDLRLLPLWNRGGDLASRIDNERRRP